MRTVACDCEGYIYIFFLLPPRCRKLLRVKTVIDDQFITTSAAPISAGINKSEVPFGSVEQLLGFLLSDLTMNQTPATAATSFSGRSHRGILLLFLLGRVKKRVAK